MGSPASAEVQLPDALLTPAEIAAFLGVPELTLQAWRSRRIGPRSYRVGKHVRYRLADVEEWLEAQRAAP